MCLKAYGWSDGRRGQGAYAWICQHVLASETQIGYF